MEKQKHFINMYIYIYTYMSIKLQNGYVERNDLY